MSGTSVRARILVVDDDLETCRLITELVAAEDRHVRHAQSAGEAADALARERFDLVISDINLNAADSGLDVLRMVRQEHPGCEVLLISGFGTLDTAVQAVRAGAFDYISKPFDIAEVQSTVARALTRPVAPPPDAVARRPPEGIIGRTAGMLAVYKQIAHAADSDVPVLIVGESGTGKELVARAVHTHSLRRAAHPFVAINCGAIPETLLESELFGHVRGSFTGAVADRKGVFEQAHGGTVLLDEVGETSTAMQVKLLRVLQDGEVRPVGASRPIRTDARVVAATNVDLERAVSEKRFRQDLFYRLGVILIRLPPLRDRQEDIPLLIEQFLARASARLGRAVSISAEAVRALSRYPWPGNVRELENTVERLVVFSRGRIDVADLPPSLVTTPGLDERLFRDLPTLDEMERRYLLHVLDVVGGNRTRAAEALGIDRRTLYRMAERFGIPLDGSERG
jgi:DNA-binding NtrC family response regulator